MDGCVVKKVEVLSDDHLRSIHTLWNTEYPDTLKHKTLSETIEYLDGLRKTNHWFVFIKDDIIGWLSIFERESEWWFAMIVDSTYHRRGIGNKMLSIAKAFPHTINGWVIDHDNDVKSNGDPYLSPLKFYQKNGFLLSNKRLELPKISAAQIFYPMKQ